MRKYTLVFSIAMHAFVVLAALGITLTATNTLPEPRRASEWIVVRPASPQPPSDRRRATRQQTGSPTTSASLAPIEASRGIRAETGLEGSASIEAPIDGLAFGEPSGVGEIGPPPPMPPPPPRRTEPLRVGGVIQPPRKLHEVAPLYPTIAQASGIEGVVILEAVIAEDGSVRDVRALRSIPLLDQAAIDAVRQWRFSPTLLNGEPVPIVMTVTVSFRRH